MGHFIPDVLRSTLMVTSFVVVIMLFIEMANVFTRGKWSQWLSRYPSAQVLLTGLLGLIPGCFGGFAVVGMWTHGVVSFGALVAAMVTSVGDEAFVMLVRMPKQAFGLFGILLAIGVPLGIILDRAGIRIARPKGMENHLKVHEHEHEGAHPAFRNWKASLKSISFTKGLLITALLLFILGMSTGFFEHEHDHGEALQTVAANALTLPLDESWFNGIFLILASVVLIAFIFVDDHFLEEHLWKHVIRQHVPKIFLWTLGALLLIHFLSQSVAMMDWVEHNRLWVLLFAVLVGLIPESGPHLVFIGLFLGGQIPFSILLANSITQDGHSTLPLLAESKRGFLAVKGVNALVGLLVGGIGLLAGF